MIDDEPVFGAPPNGVTPTVRPSAYAIITRGDGCMAVMRTPLGAFLPGGGMDPGETVEQTIHREVREEAALVVALGTWRARAVEHAWSPQDLMQYEKRSVFVAATATGTDATGGEADHRLEWLTPREAAGCLTPASHRWAVTTWMAACSASS